MAPWLRRDGHLETEPPGDSNLLLKMNNVTLWAHVASASSRFDPARKRHLGRERGLVLSGRWPMSRVNPSVLLRSDLRRWHRCRWSGGRIAEFLTASWRGG